MRRRLPLVGTWLERRGRRRVRAVMRGYGALRRSARLERIVEVREVLTNTPLAGVGRHATSLLFGAARPDAERIARQYLLVRVGGTALNESLLRALAGRGTRIVHPLPREWRRALEAQGFQLARLRSAAAWVGYVTLAWGYGTVSAGRTVLRNLASTMIAAKPRGRYAYFDRLAADNLPQPGPDGRSHDIVSWYAQWSGRVDHLEALGHGVAGGGAALAAGLPVIAMGEPVPPLQSVLGSVRYAAWSAAAVALAALDALRGRWWHALLLHESSRAALARMQDPARLAREYLFHNSGWIYRPLWTYEVERRGSGVTFYFYSTNCESFKRREGYGTQANSWQLMTWSRYLVWDEHQAAFVRRAVGEGADTRVVGPIWFGTCARQPPPGGTGAVAVFDVQPWRRAGYSALGLAEEYYTPVTSRAFLDDIHAAVSVAGGRLLFKRKRQVGRWLHPRYAARLRELEASPHFIGVDPGISAVRVIEQCALVISMPFTSTALLARELGKPSIYYDPHGTVQKDDRAGHGIPILTGPDELAAWISAHQPPVAASGRVAAR